MAKKTWWNITISPHGPWEFLGKTWSAALAFRFPGAARCLQRTSAEIQKDSPRWLVVSIDVDGLSTWKNYILVYVDIHGYIYIFLFNNKSFSQKQVPIMVQWKMTRVACEGKRLWRCPSDPGCHKDVGTRVGLWNFHLHFRIPQCWIPMSGRGSRPYKQTWVSSRVFGRHQNTFSDWHPQLTLDWFIGFISNWL